MILIENPAARLLAILEKGKSISSETFCRNVWTEILDVETVPDMLLPRLAKVIELPNQTIELLNILDTSDKHKNASQHWISQVNGGFINQSLHGKWETFISYIDVHTINYLAMTSEFFEMKSNIKSHNETQELSDIRQTLQKLLNDILENEELDKDIKRYLVRSLQRVIVAIDEHFISGYTPIIEAIETTLGHLVIDRTSEGEKVRTAFYKTGVVGEFFDALNIISAMVTLRSGLPLISYESYQALLPLLPN